MSALELVALVIGGGLGAGGRYVVDGLVMRGRTGVFPLGILVVNVTGSFALGLLTGMAAVIGPLWMTILGVGVLGGFTTFSTVSVESVLLAQAGRRDWAWLNLLGTLVAAVIAAAVGFMLGGLLPR
ncbi:fluoride efflux transporter CrcB [Microbacterium sp. T2.11-28]|uniref:fluoride efflux transporter CrcB n=1 Tax=unclassified Microbacterium TaxID=2609290 RepID=UPI00247791DF|nr:fluoride efflux transporter CrcB [Microbacterium sp. T2.11-28]CAI9389847.1 Putative fluoride ion transporter CrcB [Microbacterium sp. T2.11-28]